MELSAILAFLIYISCLLAIGLLASKKQKTASGFLLGNRSLGYWVAAISANASDMSVWIFMGLPVAVYTLGIIEAWMAVGLILFMWLNWQIVAPRLRRMTEKYDSLTLFHFFEKRTGQNAKALRITSALIATFFLTIYISAGITGMGYLFESLFGINFILGCILSIGAILIYASLGGFNAICYTDFAQGIFLLLVIVFVPFAVFLSHGDETFMAKEISFGSFFPSTMTDLNHALILAFGWGIGYFGQPHILNKFMAVKNPSELYKSQIIGTIWQILALGGSILTGVAAWYYFKAPLADSELIFIEMTKGLFSPFFASLVLCAILSATLSTIDSQIIVLASVVSEDLYGQLINKNSDDKQILFVSRIATIVICLVGFGLAMLKIGSIHDVVYYCWVGMGASFGPVVLASLYFKKVTKEALLTGMIAGATIGIGWILTGSPISATIPGFVTGFLTILLVSYWQEGSKNISAST